MRFPFITRAAHERILRACEDAALERLEAEANRQADSKAMMIMRWADERKQLEQAHADALDRYRGRMRPAAREAADQREALYGISHDELASRIQDIHEGRGVPHTEAMQRVRDTEAALAGVKDCYCGGRHS
jgi:hypothetical protein